MLYFLLLISVFIFASSSVLCNRAVKNGVSAECLNIVNNLPAGIVLSVYFLCTYDISSISFESYILIALVGLVWSVAALCRYKSYYYLHTSSVRIFNCLQLVIIALTGYFLFQEEITLTKIIGMLLVIVGIITISSVKGLKSKKGVLLCLLNVSFASAAIILEKYTTESLPLEAIVASAYLIPGLVQFFTFKDRFNIGVYKKAIKFKQGLVPLFSLLVVFGYYFKMYVFASGGEIITVTIICRSGIIFVIGIEWFIVRKIPEIKKRCLAGGVATAGVILATVM